MEPEEYPENLTKLYDATIELVTLQLREMVTMAQHAALEGKAIEGRVPTSEDVWTLRAAARFKQAIESGIRRAAAAEARRAGQIGDATE